MLQNLRSELKAIRQFEPSIEMRTQTERDAVLIRRLRIAELVTKILEIASRN
jgi:hypothetical protein